MRVAGVPNAGPKSRARMPSERDAHGKMQAELVHVLSVREIHAKRTERRAHAYAGTIAQREVDARERIGGVAGIDERCDAPRSANPADRLGIENCVVASRNRRVTFLHAEAFERIAAHRRIAAGAKEERRRDAVTRRRKNRSALRAQLQLAHATERNPRGEAADHAAKSARGDAWNPAAALHAGDPSGR